MTVTTEVDASWDIKDFCPNCNTERPFNVEVVHGTESASCALCGYLKETDWDEDFGDSLEEEDNSGWGYEPTEDQRYMEWLEYGRG